MGKALAIVVALGLLIGFAWPSGETGATAAADDGVGTAETVLQRESNGHFYVHAKVNGELVRFMVDTGASNVALTVADAQRAGLRLDPEQFAAIGEGASGEVRGTLITLDSVEVDGKRVDDVSGAVLEGSRISLLGQSYLSRMGEVQMRGDYMVLRQVPTAAKAPPCSARPAP